MPREQNVHSLGEVCVLEMTRARRKGPVSTQTPDGLERGGQAGSVATEKLARDKGPFSSDTARHSSCIAGHSAQGEPHSPTLGYCRGDTDVKSSLEEEAQSQKSNDAPKGGRVGAACTANPPNLPDSPWGSKLALWLSCRGWGALCCWLSSPGGFRLFPGASLGPSLASLINAHVLRTHHALFIC